MMTMSTLNLAHNLQDLVRPRVDRCYSMPLALKGNGLTTGKETYLHQLTPEQVEECVTAMRKFMSKSLNLRVELKFNTGSPLLKG